MQEKSSNLRLNCDYIPQISRIKWTLVLGLINRLLGCHLRAVDDGALALAVLYLIKDALKAFVGTTAASGIILSNTTPAFL